MNWSLGMGVRNLGTQGLFVAFPSVGLPGLTLACKVSLSVWGLPRRGWLDSLVLSIQADLSDGVVSTRNCSNVCPARPEARHGFLRVAGKT